MIWLRHTDGMVAGHNKAQLLHWAMLFIELADRSIECHLVLVTLLFVWWEIKHWIIWFVAD